MAIEQPPASVPDFAALRSCWHPVGFADELGGDPKRVRLLGEDLVAWRDSEGQPHVLRDLCIHRGTALSLGRVVGDRLMCPYHGWQYGSDGICRLIPQLEDPTRIPGKARGDAFTCQAPPRTPGAARRRVPGAGTPRDGVGGGGRAALGPAARPGARRRFGLDPRRGRPVLL